KQNDTWYDVDEHTNTESHIGEMKLNLEKYILPFFASITNKSDFLLILEKENTHLSPLGKLVVYGELNLFDKAKLEYRKFFKNDLHPEFLKTVREYGLKYGLE